MVAGSHVVRGLGVHELRSISPLSTFASYPLIFGSVLSVHNDMFVLKVIDAALFFYVGASLTFRRDHMCTACSIHCLHHSLLGLR